MLTDIVATRTCRYCHEDYPADEPDLWRSRNQCTECYNRLSLEHYYASKAKRLAAHIEADPLIAPARVVVPWKKNAHMEYSQPTYDGASSCDVCPSCAVCREHVQHGRPVMCEPIFKSDLRLQKAYMARRIAE